MNGNQCVVIEVTSLGKMWGHPERNAGLPAIRRPGLGSGHGRGE